MIGNSSTANGEFHAFLYSEGEMIDLGTLGGLSSYGAAVNDAGQVTGSATTAEGETHAFLYMDGAMLDLGTISGAYSKGSDINNQGQIAGISTTPEGETHAFLYTDGMMLGLGTLGDSYSTGDAINEAGQVAGIYSNEYATHAYLRSEDSSVPLVAADSSYIQPALRALNAAGEVTGSYRVNGSRRAFLFRNGAAEDLGTLGGDDSAGFAVNDAADVTGSSTTSDGQSHAFVFADGAMLDVGTLGGDYSIGYAINAAGHVTGVASTADDEYLPFVYRDGEVVPLDVRVLGATEGVGYAINEAGQVAGWYRAFGVFEPHTRAFIATPIDVLLTRLLEKVRELRPGGSLVGKLESALEHYDAENLGGSCGGLGGFVNQVGAQAEKLLGRADADALEREAVAIRDALGCG
ncbi:MAG: hypothetical protein JXB36_13395 [Gammaproteobacteria bacterium]|nr:hypothetical protein [Gammaproteobacteria bacterium]